eukprot:364796-Chlamydomonas_euryale.AAC.13
MNGRPGVCSVPRLAVAEALGAARGRGMPAWCGAASGALHLLDAATLACGAQRLAGVRRGGERGNPMLKMHMHVHIPLACLHARAHACMNSWMPMDAYMPPVDITHGCMHALTVCMQ